MCRLILNYNNDSEHFLLPIREEKLKVSPKSGKPITYIGTVAFRKSGCAETAGRFDVYFTENWKSEWGWITMLKDKKVCYRQVFVDAIHSPDTAKPLFDCDAIKVFAEEGYYFVNEETGERSLKSFNIRHHKKTISSHYHHYSHPFNSNGENLTVEYQDGIPVNITR
jgi:hypothetical protein